MPSFLSLAWFDCFDTANQSSVRYIKLLQCERTTNLRQATLSHAQQLQRRLSRLMVSSISSLHDKPVGTMLLLCSLRASLTASAMSQKHSAPWLSALISVCPSAVNMHLVTSPVCCVVVAKQVPSLYSHSFTSLSAPPLASICPSGCTATDSTGLV